MRYDPGERTYPSYILCSRGLPRNSSLPHNCPFWKSPAVQESRVHTPGRRSGKGRRRSLDNGWLLLVLRATAASGAKDPADQPRTVPYTHGTILGLHRARESLGAVPRCAPGIGGIWGGSFPIGFPSGEIARQSILGGEGLPKGIPLLSSQEGGRARKWVPGFDGTILQHRSGGTPVGGSRLPQRASTSAAEGTPENTGAPNLGGSHTARR
jgi:hypothetical protein